MRALFVPSLLALSILAAAGAVACGDADLLGAPDGESGDALLAGTIPAGAILVTTTNVNFREGPSRSAAIKRVLPRGTRVTATGGAPQDSFYPVTQGGDEGWVHGGYLSLVSGGGDAGIAFDAGGARNVDASALAPCTPDRPDGACRVFSPTGRTSAQNPAFSPDGSKLLFTIWKSGYNAAPADLAVMPSTGGSATTIVRNGASNVNLPGTSWNAATNRITYACDVDDGPDEIYTADPDGSNQRRVTRHSGNTSFIEPSFSPDGQSIVYEATPSESSAEIWIVKADGTGARRITQGSVDRQPNWSPAGDKILFQRQDGDWAIFTVNVDGSNVHRVTPPGDSSTDASWSPDGTRIVYSSERGGLVGANIFIIGANGGAPTRVTNNNGYDGAVSWSPDGKWLAFESSPNPSGEAITSIWRIAVP